MFDSTGSSGTTDGAGKTRAVNAVSRSKRRRHYCNEQVWNWKIQLKLWREVPVFAVTVRVLVLAYRELDAVITVREGQKDID